MFLIFEGLDKAGKGTLEREVLKATNYKHIIVDRGLAGYITFDCIFKRITNPEDKCVEIYNKTFDSLRKIKDDILIIYCKAPVEVALKRIMENGESCPYNYIYAQGVYNNFINKLYREQQINVIDIDTAKSIKECAKEIIKKIEEVQGEL